MNMEKDIKIAGIGSPIVDLLAYVEDSFINEKITGEKGGMLLISDNEMKNIVNEIKTELHKAPGGSAGNTIFAMCRLGAKASMTGKLGNDENGDFYKSTLEQSGGNSSGLKTDNDFPTAVSICLVTPDTQRTMRTHLGAAMNLSPEDIKEEDFKGFPLLHTEGYLLFNKELVIHILETAKKAGCKISLDLSSFEVINATAEFLPDLIKKYVDIIFANEDEAEAFCKTKEPEKALEILSQYCETAVVKLGEKGSVIKSENNIIKVEPVYCEKPIDTTGAGDYWAAGFLYGYLKGLEPEKCGRIGSVLGAEVVSILGAELSDKQWEKISEQIKNIIS
ncbi:MAG: adenosine kinase [Deltaproteobacteria bacterium]|nr:MAG: adenosine kinase [Deltaproteobacteria bacterium]